MGEYRKRAKIFQAMSHPVRLQILEILAQGPACVCDLIFQTQQRQAYISQHLMLLRQTSMVKSTRLGLQMQYEFSGCRLAPRPKPRWKSANKITLPPSTDIIPCLC